MLPEKAPSYTTDTDPISFIFSGQSEIEAGYTYAKHEAHNEPPLAFKVGSLALGSLLGIGIGAFIGENVRGLSSNYNSATTYTSMNNEISDFASELAGMPVRVDCNDTVLDERTYNENGKTYAIQGQVIPITFTGEEKFSVPVTTLRESICTSILDFDPSRPPTPILDTNYYDQIIAQVDYSDSVYVMLHEIEHLKQVFDEAEATCYAGQKLEGSLRNLGYEDQAAYEAAAATASSQRRYLPDSYVSEECAPGGALDLGISDIYIGK